MKIFIDAGHNHQGADTGAQGNGLKEQDITYSIAQKLGKILLNKGIQVKYSRPNLTESIGSSLSDSINKRASMANQWVADLFISIHCNAHANQTANGTETLIYAQKGQAECLASEVQNQLIQTLGTTNRGVKVQNVGVLRLSNMPAILIETAFITNAMDSQILKNRQDDIAGAIAIGILDYLGVKGDIMFKDVAQNDYAYNHIKKLKDYGIINGDENGNFNPNQPITRRDVAIMIANALTVCGK